MLIMGCMVVGLVQKRVEREIGDREFSFALLYQRSEANLCSQAADRR